jgi:hypothetical protein
VWESGRESKGPQRFARMLLVTQDHLMKRWDVDYFAAAMFVPEVALLGNSVDEIRALARKLNGNMPPCLQ